MEFMTEIHPQNATLHALLRQHGVKGTGEVYDLDGWQLHTHPDLCDRLQSLNPACYRAVFGVPILSNDRGLYFGVAMGTSVLALRLPGSEAAEAAHTGARGFPDAGDAWTAVDPWTDLEILKRWGRAALLQANSLKE
jgi:hypothetical protein